MVPEVAQTSLGLVYTEQRRQCWDVDGDIVLIKLLRFLNKPSESF